MARPIDEAKRREIAHGALAVLRERGVMGARMSHIADELGIKRPTLYHYFSSIPEIFDYAVADLRDAEVAFVASRLAGQSHPLDALWACLTGAFAFYRSRGLEDFVFLICQGWAAGGPEERDRFSSTAMRFLGPMRELLVGLVRGGLTMGAIRSTDPELLVDAALSVLHGAIVHEVLTGTSAEPTLDFFKTHVLDPLRVDEEL